MTEVITRSEAETVEFGGTFAARLLAGDVVALVGELGAGKTRLVMGACRALGVKATVNSPTFTLINEYRTPSGKVVHIDLYRISKRAELAELGLEEYFDGSNICFIEWAEVVKDLLPPGHYHVTLEHGEQEGERKIRVEQRSTDKAEEARAHLV